MKYDNDGPKSLNYVSWLWFTTITVNCIKTFYTLLVYQTLVFRGVFYTLLVYQTLVFREDVFI